MELWKLAAYGLASVIVSVISGIAGAGGGLVLAPLLIILGLSPAQAVATDKFNGLALTVGALGGMRSQRSLIKWHRVLPVMLLALLVGLIVPFAIRGLDSQVYRIVMGVILILMIPVLLLKKIGIQSHRPSGAQKVGGGVLLTLALFLQGTSGGLSALVNIVLMGMLGMTATEANITKRWSQLILIITVVIGLLWSGLILWQLLLVSIPCALTGGYIGGHIAVKKGNKFVINVLIGLMVVSAAALIWGAL